MENELYSSVVGVAQQEYEVLFRGQTTGVLTAYVYAENEKDAKHQAERQGIEMNRIKAVKFLGRRKDFGHV